MKRNTKKEKKLISSGKGFDQLLKEKDALFVLFSNDGCGYCQLAEKNINQVIKSFPQLEFYQLKLAAAPEIFERYGINSVPVFKVFKDGNSVYTGFGVRSPDDIYYQLKSYFDSGNSYFKEIADNN
ncbi:thioredoxin 1 [Halanaerobium saccharolyticum]|uniref:Thioredoxin 1 n=1 Tax=Halanaerobium saccharolyticum TaxID=43595 RepID=A0A4R7ZDS7_9FIRM|nr:thioredoxin family protein [Halanaerobium saccharolyticum]RAK11203.1 thioredoxin 1 [Halanaerobium saccharolyticum]TDW07054.1 thioredoxin 1 [Halanaerobium saccharolyticum]TDX63819.1 thioredoxin 1 [Halanaerobium saccharolyticum]